MDQKAYDRNRINAEIEELIKTRLANLPEEEKDSVYTLGIGVPYADMVRLMDAYDGEDGDVYIVKGSDERVGAAGLVFSGAGGERMFFGLLEGAPSKRAYPLEDVDSVSQGQLWCVGKIEFDVGDSREKGEGSLCSLLRACMAALS